MSQLLSSWVREASGTSFLNTTTLPVDLAVERARLWAALLISSGMGGFAGLSVVGLSVVGLSVEFSTSFVSEGGEGEFAMCRRRRRRVGEE